MPVVLNISPIQQKEYNNRHVTTNGRFRQLCGRFKCFGVIFLVKIKEFPIHKRLTNTVKILLSSRQ